MVHEVHGSRRVPILRSILVGAGDLGTQSQHGRRIHENPSRLADFGGRALCHFHSPCLHHDKRFSDDLRRVLPILALHDFFRDDTDAENGGSCGTIRNKNSGAKVSEFYFLVTIAKLSSPASPQSIQSQLRNCGRCPPGGRGGKRARPSGRRAFFAEQADFSPLLPDPARPPPAREPPTLSLPRT